MRPYEYRHIVSFEETNLVGNVYYTNHLRWQGRVREIFLHEFAPTIRQRLAEDLALATVHCSCDYFLELRAFDEVLIRMRLGSIAQNRVSLQFEYWRQTREGEELVARGRQDVACMRRVGGQIEPAPVPEELREAFGQFNS